MSNMLVSPQEANLLVQNHKNSEWKAIEDTKDPYIEDMGRFSVAKFTRNQDIEEMATFIRVVSSEYLVVNEGTMYRIVVEIRKENVSQSRELYVAKVLDHKHPFNSWTLLSFECSTLLALPSSLAL
ncbi:cysteine proteinase inhibitor 5-like [Cucumis melo var. makuwa]|uniref:Cysteine proteinase inhibitor 5-like n=2 Tax=Cucumis melo TaxID=3656 RepID=A0A5A7UB42_CUCMM|nr:cysteine proteinase inhibitor 5-like [Cucumis melo var. makuwa]TYK01666.1 cysteine proteinase inhibitor 5-like [Cucumis melo var. makuwa]